MPDGGPDTDMATEKAIKTGSIQHYEMMQMVINKSGRQIIRMLVRLGIHCMSEIESAKWVWIPS